MEFGTEKCNMQIIKKCEKRYNGRNRIIKLGKLGEKENCKYLGILEADVIKRR